MSVFTQDKTGRLKPEEPFDPYTAEADRLGINVANMTASQFVDLYEAVTPKMDRFQNEVINMDMLRAYLEKPENRDPEHPTVPRRMKDVIEFGLTDLRMDFRGFIWVVEEQTSAQWIHTDARYCIRNSLIASDHLLNEFDLDDWAAFQTFLAERDHFPTVRETRKWLAERLGYDGVDPQNKIPGGKYLGSRLHGRSLVGIVNRLGADLRSEKTGDPYGLNPKPKKSMS